MVDEYVFGSVVVGAYVYSGFPLSGSRLSLLMSGHMSSVGCCGSALHCVLGLSGMHIYVAPSRTVYTVGVIALGGVSWDPGSIRLRFSLFPRLRSSWFGLLGRAGPCLP